MRAILTLTAVAFIGSAGAAYAIDQTHEDARGPTLSTDQMKAKIGELGYHVERIEKDDGAYRVLLTERESGGKVKAAFDAKTGELIHAKLAQADREADERENAYEDRKAPKQTSDRKQEHENRNKHRNHRE